MMINIQLDKNSEGIFKLELDQAWSHYRHLEDTRTKYLNFFFTIFLASIGFLLTLTGLLNNKITVLTYFGFSVFILALFFFSVILLATIVRIGYVLASYELIMDQTRKYFHGVNSPVLDVWDIRRNIPREVNRGLFSIQNASRSLIFGVCALLSFIEFALAYQVAISSKLQGLDFIIFIFAVSSGIMMIFILLYILHVIRKANNEISVRKKPAIID